MVEPERPSSLWRVNFGNYLTLFIAPGLSLIELNPLSPACAGTPPRVGAVSDRSAVDRANTVAENQCGSDLLEAG